MCIKVFACSLIIGLTAAASIAAPRMPEYVEGEAIVSFKPSVDVGSARTALSRRSIALTKHFAFLSEKHHRNMGLVRMPGRTTAELVAELKKDPLVATAEPNYIRRFSIHLPNDFRFSELWGLRNTGQTVNGFSGASGDDIKFSEAWSLARSPGSNVVVAIIDSGVDYTHPELVDNIWVNPGESPINGADDDANGYIDDYHGWDFANEVFDPTDSGYHGTHVAGTVAAAGNNQIGVIGVNYRAKIMALKASSDGQSLTDSAIIEAIQYATMMKVRGVNVVAINASFGGPGFDSVMSDAIQAAGDAGIVFCAAAGNDSNDNDVWPTYPASYNLPNMIVAAATDQNDELAYFSNFGATTVHLSAPGVNVLSLMPLALADTTIYVQQDVTTFSAEALTYSGMTTGFTATIIDCGEGNAPDFPPQVNGNIALIARGSLFFYEKIGNAMAAGARAAIIFNNEPGPFSGTLSFASNWIPTLAISMEDGMTLQALTPTNGTVAYFADSTTAYQYLDGTSMATPHVAGAVAFAAMNFPYEDITQRVARILGNVDIIPDLTNYVRTSGRLNLQKIVDTDANALPDWWEQQYFGQLTGTNPNSDPDHDGANNRAEWLSGTNPTNAASVLRLTAVCSGGTNLVIQWPSVAGKIYTLEGEANLLTGFNSIVHTNISASPPFNTEMILMTPAAPHYFRLRLEP
jgi:subtilisin family serine protease